MPQGRGRRRSSRNGVELFTGEHAGRQGASQRGRVSAQFGAGGDLAGPGTGHLPRRGQGLDCQRWFESGEQAGFQGVQPAGISPATPSTPRGQAHGRAAGPAGGEWFQHLERLVERPRRTYVRTLARGVATEFRAAAASAARPQVGSLARDSRTSAAASISATEEYSPIGSGTSTIAATTTARQGQSCADADGEAVPAGQCLGLRHPARRQVGRAGGGDRGQHRQPERPADLLVSVLTTARREAGVVRRRHSTSPAWSAPASPGRCPCRAAASPAADRSRTRLRSAPAPAVPAPAATSTSAGTATAFGPKRVLHPGRQPERDGADHDRRRQDRQPRLDRVVAEHASAGRGRR